MNDDFNTPVAVAVLFELAADLNRTRALSTAALLKALGAMLGVLQQAPRTYLQLGNSLDVDRIDAAIRARQQAKAARDFVLADKIRQDLLLHGIELQDSAQGTTWVRS